MSSILNSAQYIGSCTETLTKRLYDIADQSAPVDLGKLLNMLALPTLYAFDVLGELFYGKSFGMVERRKDVGYFGKSIESLLPIFAVGGTLPSYLTSLYLMYKINPFLVTSRRNHCDEEYCRCIGRGYRQTFP
ncbi:hypothetical protein ASPCAL07132 [Aspergillus calidoustus]|uniref:Uncharacterized protein n=1 Tax=Aspergillus calidoustus TaxID=454130 RepID=A0A0U5GXW1_ASPCI|nr:hypothetical protein ASPCAL07132 [Aspergillus calidoustus]